MANHKTIRADEFDCDVSSFDFEGGTYTGAYYCGCHASFNVANVNRDFFDLTYFNPCREHEILKYTAKSRLKNKVFLFEDQDPEEELREELITALKNARAIIERGFKDKENDALVKHLGRM